MLYLAMLIWFAIGIYIAGSVYAFCQRSVPAISKEVWPIDALMSISIGLCGPIGLVAIFFVPGVLIYGFMLPGFEDWRKGVK